MPASRLADHADAIDAELVKLGYRCLHRSLDAANYARADERVEPPPQMSRVSHVTPP